MSQGGSGGRSAYPDSKVLAVVMAALVAASCSAQTPSPSPTATPVPAPSAVPIVSAPIARATGGTVAMTGGPTLAITAGGVSADTTATIRASAAPVPPEADAWPAAAIGTAWDIDLGGQSLAEPATLTFHFDAATLPAGLSEKGLLIAYIDPATKVWHPVPVTIDPAGSAAATITHLSTWALFAFDLNRWLVVLKALAAGQISDLTSAFAGLLSKCSTSGGGFTIDNALANNMVEGCLAGAPTKGTAAITVTNLRAFALSLSSPHGYLGQQLVAPGASVPFSVLNTDVPPATISATMTTDGLWWSVTDIVMRLLPGWTELKASPGYATIVTFAAAETKAVWDASGIWADIAAGNFQQAAEATVTLLTGKSYLDALVAALQTAATKYGLTWLAVVDASTLAEILKVVNLADLIVTTWSFFGDYFFNAQTGVRVSWRQPLSVVVPAPDGSGMAVKVRAGATLEISATGEWCTGGIKNDGSPSCGNPGGIRPPDAGETGLLDSSVWIGALIGRWDGGAWFKIGAAARLKVPPGVSTLHLACNDRAGFYSDNRGNAAITIVEL
jgi:hypothetical protein